MPCSIAFLPSNEKENSTESRSVKSIEVQPRGQTHGKAEWLQAIPHPVAVHVNLKKFEKVATILIRTTNLCTRPADHAGTSSLSMRPLR